MTAVGLNMTINGGAAPTVGTFGVVNPATANVFAQAPACSRGQLDEAMTAAQTAFRNWREDDKVRRVVLGEMGDALEAAADWLAPLLTTEQGKPLRDARMEIGGAVAWLRYYADLESPREIVQDDEHGYVEVVRRPLGVVAAITPWNFPVALAAWKVAPALRAGNTMVLKPSPFTPLTTLALGEIWREVLPPGVLNVVSGPDPLGAWMTAHPVPRKISFTGSTATGKKVAVAAAEDVKRVTLELGGNDPAIVLDDADPEQIADSLFWAAFANNGQVCCDVKRVYVHQRRHGDFVAALVARAKARGSATALNLMSNWDRSTTNHSSIGLANWSATRSDTEPWRRPAAARWTGPATFSHPPSSPGSPTAPGSLTRNSSARPYRSSHTKTSMRQSSGRTEQPMA